MPASWANALAPTIALLGCTPMPVSSASNRDEAVSSGVWTMVSSPRTCRRVRSNMTISSSDALPARSPMPLTVHSTWPAPATRAASEFATARPRSSWQWTDSVTSSMPSTVHSASTNAVISSGTM